MPSIDLTTILTLLTVGFLWIGAVAVLWAGDGRRQMQNLLAAGFAVAAGLAALGLLPLATGQAVVRIAMGSFFGDFTFVPDGLGVFLAAVATVVGSLAVIFSIDYMHEEAQLGRYYALVLFFIGAMAGLVLAGNLLLLFLFWEMVAFCSYALISFHNDDPKAVAGGIKALVITQLGGLGLLAGVLTAYATLGNYQVEYFLANAHTVPPAALAVIAFGFLIAAAAKSAQVPFHTWLPDAMEAPTPVSALIHAATMVNAGVYLLARFYPAFADVPGWRTAVMTVGVLSALLAAGLALMATDLKRVLAYSTISQLGYMVYAVGVGAIFASQFHLLSHAVFKALLFLGAGAVIHLVGTRDMQQMGGLGRQMPFVRNVFVIGALALAGIPILNGFWSKELILEAGFAGGPFAAYVIMLAVAGLTALYTFRTVWLVFFGPPGADSPSRERNPAAGDAPPAMRVALGTLVLGTFVTWLLAGPFGNLLEIGIKGPAFGHVSSTLRVVEEVLAAPTTLIALIVVSLGLAVWYWRAKLPANATASGAAGFRAWFARDGGFEGLNHAIAGLIQGSSEALRTTQTGQLNWNIVGIAGGLAIVLAILALGA
ncbi:MAG: NADH-quinone oxidoreductase subunit L [Chloroflexi bacterium]|nr:NADH-quinone oxidoreductase subunit L [Chloroflexota bacterium]